MLKEKPCRKDISARCTVPVQALHGVKPEKVISDHTFYE